MGGSPEGSRSARHSGAGRSTLAPNATGLQDPMPMPMTWLSYRDSELGEASGSSDPDVAFPTEVDIMRHATKVRSG